LEPTNRIEQARKEAGLSAKDFALKIGVDKTTVSNWETSRRPLSLERLLQVAKLLNVSVSYLLGLDEQPLYTVPVGKSMLPALHWTPVWIRSRGWALVNAIEKTFVFADKSAVPFNELQEPIFIIPPAFSLGLRGAGDPLDIDDIRSKERVWVEPISSDPELAAELRGWYKPYGRLVENEYGNRFYLDSYGAKWLAFESCFDGK
jgi:transcriptional regulator with XRE-family HTH domain